MNEFHVLGPPGTAKTTRACHDIAAAVEVHGADRVMVLTFTRAAAIEIEARACRLAPHMIGTLHSICYHALGRPVIAETKIKDFNERHPVYTLSAGRSASVDDAFADAGDGTTTADGLMFEYQLYRARLTPRELWRTGVLGFAKAWETWKDGEDLHDFTDLVEAAAARFSSPPGHPNVIFVDEAQDLNAMQFALIRQWAAHCDSVVLYGDPDQTIYSWCGADADQLIGDKIPEANRRYLKQSYRVPTAVHAKAEAWIRGSLRRQQKEYLPREGSPGEVNSLTHVNFREPQALIQLLADDIQDDRTAMVLASCSYMLRDLIGALRDAGIPFHNPYRKTRGDWNPLANGDGSTINRIRAFMNVEDTMFPAWTAMQLRLWVGLVKAERILKRGAKKAIDDLAELEPAKMLNQTDWLSYFQGDPFGFAPISPKWLLENALESKKKAIDFPIRVVERQGLGVRPRIVVGTIHSVKGGEADSVYLMPDLSQSGWLEWRGGDPDSVRRTIYVGMTRAREKLSILSPAGPLAVEI